MQKKGKSNFVVAKIIFFFLFLLILTLFIFAFYFTVSKFFVIENEDIQIVDGDTIKFGDKYFRSLYIDTPELHEQKQKFLSITKISNETCLKDFAKKAKEFVEKRKNSLSIFYLFFLKDKYNRFLSEFNYKNGSSLDIELVENGYAICYYREKIFYLPKTEECLKKEKEARKNKIGLWSCK